MRMVSSPSWAIRWNPNVLPINRLRQGIDFYLSNIDTVTIIYDEITGWAYRPESSRDEGNFTIIGVGLRSQREYRLEPLPKTLRIAAFGDSYTAGDDVNDSDVWTNQLEITLIEAGIRAEVLNFGVGGFGMGQAYLRWQKLGRAFEPDIVIFGFQAENLSRNINIFRHLYRQSPGILFSKPRFILTDGELEVLNMPTVPARQSDGRLRVICQSPFGSVRRILSQPRCYCEVVAFQPLGSIHLRNIKNGDGRR